MRTFEELRRCASLSIGDFIMTPQEIEAVIKWGYADISEQKLSEWMEFARQGLGHFRGRKVVVIE
jgi:hypothetical protein